MASKGSEAMVSNAMGDLDGDSLVMHRTGRPGKIEIIATKPLVTQRDLALANSPGVAAPCLEIAKDPNTAYDYTIRGNLVAVISNGTAVLGLGDIGALARKPGVGVGVGRHGAARGNAGDGGQGRPVQALRRRRLHRSRGRHQGCRPVRQLR